MAFDGGQDDTYARPFRLLVEREYMTVCRVLKGIRLTTSEYVHGGKREDQSL